MAGTAARIVAGYDGSPDSEQALDWAVDEAERRGLDLTICHACAAGYLPWLVEGAGEDAARQYGERVLAEGLQRAQAATGSSKVQALLATGPPARVLCQQSIAAAMVVVGSRGRGGLAGLRLGSVSLQVAAHATGPVTIVRGQWQPVPGRMPAPVAVGADGSPASRAAVVFAFEEAALRGVPVLAVCALADTAGVFGGARQVEADFEKLIAKCQDDYPDVMVCRRIEQGAPRGALIDAAAHAQLLVVGARGRGGLPGMMLGSVGVAVLHHASCPVSVIRQR